MLRLAFIFLFFFAGIVDSNGQNRKQERLAKKQVSFVKTDSLITSKKYCFKASTAIPVGMHSFDLSTHVAEMKIINDSAYSYLPFYGTVYNPSYGNSEGGVKFETLYNEYTIEVDSVKMSFNIHFIAKAPMDTYRCNLHVSASGTANLSITSNNKASISYFGRVKPLNENLVRVIVQ